MRIFSLDARLAAIENMIPPCAVVADIGADHGRLGAHLLAAQRCERVVFTDISAPSLEKARQLVRRMGLDARAAFAVGDGALALPERPDAAVIAGMGGETIADIVEAGRAKLEGALVVMQPNARQYALRKRLMGIGYRIEDECVACAGGRWYVVVAARPGRAQYDERALLIGPVLLARRDERLSRYAQFQIRVTAKALAGAQKGADPAAERFAWELDEWKEVLKWLQP